MPLIQCHRLFEGWCLSDYKKYVPKFFTHQYSYFSGRTLGPFGGEGGMKFDSGDFSFSGCHLGYISGKAGMRLDQLSLHWKCPREKEYMGLEEDEDIIPNYSTTNKYSPCDILILFLLISLMCRWCQIGGFWSILLKQSVHKIAKLFPQFCIL